MLITTCAYPLLHQTAQPKVTCGVVESLSGVQLFCDPMDCSPWAPLSLEFSRQEYWRSCHLLLQGIFPT